MATITLKIPTRAALSIAIPILPLPSLRYASQRRARAGGRAARTNPKPLMFTGLSLWSPVSKRATSYPPIPQRFRNRKFIAKITT